MARLGVNIDHIATLRNQRDEGYPSIQKAAEISLESGADQITIHLREDRRHIKDADLPIVKSVCEANDALLNLEVGTDLQIAEIAGRLSPDWVCIVPEKREEKTTEGGLNLKNDIVFEKVLTVSKMIKKMSPRTKVSLFVEADTTIFERVLSLGEQIQIDAVEIHTGEFAKKYLDGEDFSKDLDEFKRQKLNYEKHKIGYHAGHGLTKDSVLPLVKDSIFTEYNIGHWIISEAAFHGLGNVVSDLKRSLT